MATLLPMPEVVAGATDAVLSHWLVGVDTAFTAGDTIAVIETEKAAVDLEAEADARLVRSLVADGASVAVGMPLALLAAPGERIDDVDAVLAELGVGVGASGAVDPPPVAAAPSGRIFATPLVRRLAGRHGIDLAAVDGTGPNGRIVRRDIEALLAAPAPVDEPGPVPVEQDGVTPVPHTRLRRAIARRLTASTQEIPHFSVRGSARVDALLALRASVNEVAPAKISVNDFVVKAAALAHTGIPELNATWGDDAVLQHTGVDVGVAIASRRGLVSPVLRGVESASLGGIAGRVRDLVTRADEGRLAQDELDGGTLTVSNLGSYGVEEFTAIINPPQSSILAVGAARREPVVDDDGEVRAATVLRVVLSVDHRVADGAVAARWMARFVELLERPLALLT